MSRQGNCWDSSPIESFWGRLKNTCVHGQRFATGQQARQVIMNCITAGCIRAWAISARCNTSNAGTRLSAKKPCKQRAKNSIQQSNITGNYLGNTGRFKAILKAIGAARWQRLHRTVYVAAWLAVLHFYWMRLGKNNLTKVFYYGFILFLLLSTRIYFSCRKNYLEKFFKPNR